ncbi:MAG: hypothetical protein VX075_07990 [Pseudomonadota bacterium]|nr:hypothetical protein [Pseudomonadota bacterium]
MLGRSATTPAGDRERAGAGPPAAGSFSGWLQPNAGSLAQCRIYSKYLALQIKACEEGIIPRKLKIEPTTAIAAE